MQVSTSFVTSSVVLVLLLMHLKLLPEFPDVRNCLKHSIICLQGFSLGPGARLIYNLEHTSSLCFQAEIKTGSRSQTQLSPV